MGEISRGAQGRATSGRLVLAWNYPPTGGFICLARRTAGEPQSRAPPPKKKKYHHLFLFFHTGKLPTTPREHATQPLTRTTRSALFIVLPTTHAPTLISQPRIPLQPGTLRYPTSPPSSFSNCAALPAEQRESGLGVDAGGWTLTPPVPPCDPISQPCDSSLAVSGMG